MRNYKLNQVHDSGSGVVRIGDVSTAAEWEFDGLQRFIEGIGEDWVPKGFDYCAYTIWMRNAPEQMPPVGSSTSLMIDDQRIGKDWSVVTYLASNGKVGIELSNRPI